MAAGAKSAPTAPSALPSRRPSFVRRALAGARMRILAA